MKLIHYADHEVAHIHSSKQNTKSFLSRIKPTGLWVSVEGRGSYGWKQWCKDNDFELRRLAYAHEVILSPTANIRLITNAGQLDAFTEEYKFDVKAFWLQTELTKLEKYHLEAMTIDPTMYLNWEQLAKDYDGLIIAPYIYSRRLHMGSTWYYSFDCASGVIWQKKAVQSITCIKRPASKE